MKRLALTMLTLAIAAGCAAGDASTGPVPPALEGTFVLTSYNGAELPAYMEPRLGACSSMIVGGALATSNDGHVVFSRSYTTPCRADAPPAVETRTGVLTAAGTTITVTLDADALTQAETLTGTLVGGELSLHHTVENRVVPLEQTFVLARS
jgi:hypothetical protein